MNKTRILLIMMVLSVIALCVGMTTGSVTISLQDLINILLRQGSNVDEVISSIVWNVRLPRVMMAYLVGAGLAVSGTVMQSLLGNPLASTYTLGVSAGASLGAALIIITGLTVTVIGSLLLPFVGFVFGLLTVLIVLMATRYIDSQMANQTVVLVGMITTLFVGAILTLLTALYQDHLKQLVFWQMGSFSGSTWGHIQLYFPIVIFCLFLLWIDSQSLDVLGLGEEQAKMVGVEVNHTKLRVILLSTLLAGSAVSFVGVIGFVDLIAPHVMRRYVGATHRWLMIGSALLGGILMVVGDTIARTLLSPREIPIGAVTALIGAPFFMYIYLKKRSEKG